jgi:hypothetical protein
MACSKERFISAMSWYTWELTGRDAMALFFMADLPETCRPVDGRKEWKHRRIPNLPGCAHKIADIHSLIAIIAS